MYVLYILQCLVSFRLLSLYFQWWMHYRICFSYCLVSGTLLFIVSIVGRIIDRQTPRAIFISELYIIEFVFIVRHETPLLWIYWCVLILVSMITCPVLMSISLNIRICTYFSQPIRSTSIWVQIHSSPCDWSKFSPLSSTQYHTWHTLCPMITPTKHISYII